MSERIQTNAGLEELGQNYDLSPGEVAHVQVTREDPGNEPWDVRVYAGGAVTHEWNIAGETFDFQLTVQQPTFRISVASEAAESLAVSVQTRNEGPNGWTADPEPMEPEPGDPGPLPAPRPEGLPAAEFEELRAEVEALT